MLSYAGKLNSHCAIFSLAGNAFMRIARKVFLVTSALCTFCSWEARATAINAASCSQPAVQTALNQATTGDTVAIPAGTCTWSSPMTISNLGITLTGAGAGQTIIIDGVPQSSGTAVQISVPSGKSFRITGMTIQAQSALNITTFLYIYGGSTNFRMDHMTFTGWDATYNSNGEAIVITQDIFGVIDHNSFTSFFWQFFNCMNADYGGGTYGDASWSSPTMLGTNDALYFEDNTFTNTEYGSIQSVIDSDGNGGRVVIRHNTFNTFFNGGHGTETAGRPRGTRKWEVYDNTYHCDARGSNTCFTGVQYRSGTGVVFGNTFDVINGTLQQGWGSAVYIPTYRTSDNLNWGTCDGTGPWDKNDGTVYASGTLTSGSNGTATDTSQSWTTNQWNPNGAPYSFRDVTQGWGSEIHSNTSNSLTYDTFTNSGTPHAISTGDSYQILRATICLDQPGRGKGVLLSGSLNNPTSPTPTGWVQDALEPIYVWQNTMLSNQDPADSNSGRVINNRDFYVDTGASCNGTSCTSGVGVGSFSNRPANCTAGPGGNTNGVAYWATDTNTLYVCNPTNTWTAYYTPYAYPHPISISAGPGPNPPTNLTVASVN